LAKSFIYQYHQINVSFKNGKVDGAQLKELSKIEKWDALILGDFGGQRFDAGTRALLLDIIEDRKEKDPLSLTCKNP
jgi:DNA replication protein DnaC